MILGRAPSLWVALVAAVLNVAVVVFRLPLDGLQVGALNALGLVVIGIMANEADPRAVTTLAPTFQDRRTDAEPHVGTPGVGRRTNDELVAEIARRIGQRPGNGRG